MALFEKVSVIMSMIQCEALLYEVAIGGATGKTPKKIGEAIQTYSEQDEEAILGCDRQPAQMAEEFLEWVYGVNDAPKPDWVQ